MKFVVNFQEFSKVTKKKSVFFGLRLKRPNLLINGGSKDCDSIDDYSLDQNYRFTARPTQSRVISPLL